jgi:hypothetical protein
MFFAVLSQQYKFNENVMSIKINKFGKKKKKKEKKNRFTL